MIRRALEYIFSNFEPRIIRENGKIFSDKELIEIDSKSDIEELNLSTLTSLVDYIKFNKDNLDYKNLILIVNNHDEVILKTSIDSRNKRDKIISCVARTKAFEFNSFLNKETFIIGLQSQFCDTEERNNLLKILATTQEESGVTNEDNGISQSVKTKKGVVLGENTIVPNPVQLAPFRTFVEINQPTSQFIFRIRNQNERVFKEGLGMALFEADGGIWVIECMQRIKLYLEKQLEEEIGKGLIILA